MADSGNLENLDIGSAGALKIPGGDAILGAEFHQVGTDLVITDGKGLSVALPQYFHAEHLPALVTDTGVRLAGDLVRTLTPPEIRAEACQAAPESAIGQVSSVTGSVEVRHADGSTAQLAAGDPVFQGDVVQAGADGQVNLTFVDGTNFMLGAGARMTLDELVYDPNGGQGNSFAATVMEGAFVFGTGQIAPSGNMNVNTPVGTIGIRGTTVAGTIRMEGSESVITLLPDPKTGHVGRVIISNGAGTQELNVGNATTKLVSFFITPTEPVVLPAADLMQFFDMLLQQFYDLHGGAPSNFEQGGGTGRQGATETEPTAEEALAQLDIDNFTTAAGPGDGTTTTTITGTVGFAALSPLLGYLPPEPTGFTFTTVSATGKVGESDTFGGPGSFGPDPVSQDAQQGTQQQQQSGPGFTVVTGGPDDDTLDGPATGPLQIEGNEGNDTLTGGDFDDILDGGPGNDALDAGAGDDQINGSGGDDTIVGGHGQGNDKIDGGEGIDTVTYTSADQTIIVNLETGTASGDPDIGFDTLKGIENVVGGSGNDLLIGNDAANKLSGGAGDDQIGGQGGDDTLDGGEGRDVAVFSGSLSDYLIQQNGDGYKVTDYRAVGDGVDTLSNIELARFANVQASLADVVNRSPSAPTDTDAAANTVAENSALGAAVGITAQASDTNPGDAVTYSLSDDAGGLFGIDAATGKVSLLGSLDYETAASHDITVRATDKGGLFSETTYTINVGNLDDNPISALTDIDDSPDSVSEDADVNTPVGLKLQATDGDAGTTVTYSLSDDAGGLFQIDAEGVVSVKSALDFETAQSHQITVVATSSDGSSTSKTYTIDVTNVNDNTVTAPVDSDTADNTVSETDGYGTSVGIKAFAVDADGSAVTYSLSDVEGPFNIDADTGTITLNRPLDFEGGATREVTVIATSADGSFKETTFTVTVTDVNEAPVITSDGGGETASVSVDEGSTAVTTIVSDDPDIGAERAYSLSGDDADLFQIDSNGVLSFKAAPNFEAPGDGNADNIYSVAVKVSDGALFDVQTISVTVVNANEAPVITSNGGDAAASISVAENTTSVTTVTASDPDAGTTLAYSIVGGIDQELFDIDATTGALSFRNAPNADAPADYDGNNVYEVDVQVSDGSLTDTQSIAVTVGGTNEAPVITSNDGGATAAVSVTENTAAVTTVQATDPDAGTTIAYSIVGGADQDLFSINTETGALSFKAAPNFEAPADANGDNVYVVQVQASDGKLSDTQTISVAVGNANEAPNIVSNGGAGAAVVGLTEHTTTVTKVEATDPDAGTTITFSISDGSDSALFQIDPETGVLSFIAPPDFEAKGDADGNNIYVVEVKASDGMLSDTQTISVVVEDAAEAPAITSDGGGATAAVEVAENTTAVTTVTASDPDTATTLTYSLVGGSDQALFEIDSSTGVLSFKVAPNFEAPADAGFDNIYDVKVQVSDGTSLFDTQSIAVTVTDVGEGPVITSDGGGETATLFVAENSKAVTQVTATGSDLTYSIIAVDGSDYALFDIDPTTGALSFKVAPNYEVPQDVGEDNIYNVKVEVSDGTATDSQDISIAVSNQSETAPSVPVDTDPSADRVGDNAPTGFATLVGITAASTDPDAGDRIIYTLADTFDDRFGVDVNDGRVFSRGNLDYDTQSSYVLTVIATDRDGLSSQQTFTVNLADAPTITSDDTASVAENTTEITQLDASDSDSAELQWNIVGGADGGLFEVGTDGALRFKTPAPDFENPADADQDNVYEVQVQVSDGEFADVKTINVTVTDVDEGSGNQAPRITSSLTPSVTEDSAEVMQIEVDDPDSLEFIWNIVGGADKNLFELDLAGGLRFKEPAPNFEDPADADHDNIYEVQVQVSDGEDSDVQTIKVTVTDTNGVGPVLVNHQVILAPTAPSNLIGTSELLATDGDTPPSEIVYLVKVPPANGTLYLGEGVVETGTSFTQQDVANGLLVYVPNGSAPVDDSFVVDVTDGEDTITNATVSVPVASNGAVVDGTVTFDSGTLIIGNNTYGRLDLFGASSFTVAEKLIVGYGASGDGNLTVSGNGSAFHVGDTNDFGHQLLVGAVGGAGVIDIVAGASLDVFGTGAWVSIGDDGNGVVNVDGAGSSFKVSMTSPGTEDEGISINVGGGGEGALNIKNGAEAEFSSDHSVSLNIGGQGGDVIVDNASLTMTLTGDGSGTAPLLIQIGDQFGFCTLGIINGSTVSLEGAPALIAVGTGGETAGALYLSGSTLNATEKGSILDIGSEFSYGEVQVVDNSTLNIGVAKDASSDINVDFGSLYINSSTVNSDIWVNNGHLGFGGAAIIEGSLDVFGRGSDLAVDVSGVQSGEHGVLQVSGGVGIFDGTIAFNMMGLFNASTGDSFNFLNVDGGLSVDLSRLSAVAYGVDQDFRFELVQEGSSLGMHVTEDGKTGVGAVFVGSTLGDEFTGTDAADVIFGGAGDDILGGGGAGTVGGADILNGGAGADQFYSVAGSIDHFDNTAVDDNYQAVVNGKYSELPDPIPAIDQINNFESGIDKITFAGSYFQEVVAAFNEGANFSKIAVEYDGTNAGANDAFADKKDALILDGNNNLIYDHNGSDAGYTIVAHVDSTTGTISASDIQVNNDSF